MSVVDYPEPNCKVLLIKERWLELIKSGRKTIEGRRGSLSSFQNVEKIKFKRSPKATKGVLVRVLRFRHYPNLIQFLKNENLQLLLPGIESLEEAKFIYQQFWAEQTIRQSGGIVALDIEMINENCSVSPPLHLVKPTNITEKTKSVVENVQIDEEYAESVCQAFREQTHWLVTPNQPLWKNIRTFSSYYCSEKTNPYDVAMIYRIARGKTMTKTIRDSFNDVFDPLRKRLKT